MENISYDALEKIGYKGYLLPKDAPEKVLQFGEGNFLRAFVDRFFDMGNEATGWNGKVVMVQPISGAFGFADGINAQDDLYTVLVRGKENGNTVDESRVISACSRCLNPYREDDYRAMMEVAVSDDLEIIVSNTTEAGIAYDPSCKADDMPPASFPAKLAQVLHTRWAAGKPGVIVLACELIDHNGEELLRIMNQYVSDWGWEDEFAQWMANDCTVCTTLVDTIVPGRIRDASEAAAVAERLGYEDPFLAVREPFQMWGIQGDESLAEKLPFVKAGLPGVFVTPDVTPYKKRKVRILNGAHTAFVPGSWVAGFDIVRDCMHDETIRGFMNTMLYDEVIPTLAADLDVEDCKAFAAAVENRFDNPFIDHALLSICLNSTAKWRARDLPTLKDYVAETGNLPKCLATSLATLISFYTQELVSREGDGLHLRRSDGTEYTAQDDAFVLDFYAAHAGADDAQLVHDVLTNEQMWGEDLTQIAGLEEFVVSALAVVRAEGAKQAFANAQAYISGADAGAGRRARVSTSAQPVGLGPFVMNTIQINPADNVIVALSPLAKGTAVAVPGVGEVVAVEDIPQGHKMAVRAIAAGEDVIKYGLPIGHVTGDVQPGQWLHTHNVKTNLSGEVEYAYNPTHPVVDPVEPETFMGFRRADGRAATRNELWIIPTVGCVNEVARAMCEQAQDLVDGSLEGVYYFPHPFGCSQTGADHAQTRRLLVALSRHPNAAGVLFLSLGCENCTHQQVLDELGDFDHERVRFLTCQDVADEQIEGHKILAELADLAKQSKREPIPASELVIGLKCGGSDGLSGITANPTIGRVSDMVVARGGTSVLTEVPEMFGAESILLDRCENEQVFNAASDMLNGFKDYFISHGEVVYENPSPGNKDGGITTLEDKSCGCVQKGGSAPIVDVLPYAGQANKHGLNMLCGPGNDMVSTTALTAAGCHVILFSTGRGTPFGAPAPTLKVFTNQRLCDHKANWMDFNAGVIATGERTLDEAAHDLYQLVLETASGKLTSAERRGCHEISIWKDGVCL